MHFHGMLMSYYTKYLPLALFCGFCVVMFLLSWEHSRFMELQWEYSELIEADRLENRVRYAALQLDHSQLAERVFTCDAQLLDMTTASEALKFDHQQNAVRLTTCDAALAALSSSRPSCQQHEQDPTTTSNMRSLGWATPVVYVGSDANNQQKTPGFDARWTSQAGQDRTLFRLFGGKRGGYFIDLAANDAVALSNTFTLEQEYNWTGLCIEANPQYFEQLYLRNCRVVQAVVGQSTDEPVDFKLQQEFGGVVGREFDNKYPHDNRGRGPSTMRTQALTVSLEHMFKTLAVPRVIDYLSLDIEGAEGWVFETFPWDRYTMLVVTVERPKLPLVRLLVTHGYLHLCDHGDFGDQMWMHSSFPNRSSVVAGLKLDRHRMCSG